MAAAWRNIRVFLAWAFVMWLGFHSMDHPYYGQWILGWYVMFTACGVAGLMHYASIR